MHGTRATVRDLRRGNRSTLLSTLFFDGPLSRFELGRNTGLSAATVTNVVGDLIDSGLVTEAGQVESNGGRPRVLLRVDPEHGRVVGIDVGETGVRMELFDLSLARLATVDRPLRSPRPDVRRTVAEIASGYEQLLADAEVSEADVMGVGVGVPGVVEQADTVQHVNAPTIGWHDVELPRLVHEAGLASPVYVENGAVTQGQAEVWFGAGRGARNTLVALIGSGVGAAVIIDGKPYRGAASSAGEWGHTTLVYGGRPCRCGGSGCLETYVGAAGILDRFRKARGGKPAPRDDEPSQLRFLLESAERSATARRVLDETVNYLGAGLANLVNLFSPERIVLGGWAGLTLGDRLLPEIREATARQALRHAFERSTIELCTLGPDAVAVGAATLPVAALLAGGADPRTVDSAARPANLNVGPR